MNDKAVADHIVKWLGDYLAESHSKGFVVGISGGVDSAVTSILAAMTDRPVLCVSLPIHQPAGHLSRAEEHMELLGKRFGNVSTVSVDLTSAYDTFVGSFNPVGEQGRIELTNANTRARLRMTALYYFAGIENMLVTGTGNKIEDFGVGFFTKYGDGGVDISPIGDLTKSEVFSLARYLGVSASILNAAPADGLFDDDRSDEDQIGASYPELEWAMEQAESGAHPDSFTGREREVYEIYLKRNRANRHKMSSPPVCVIPKTVK